MALPLVTILLYILLCLDMCFDFSIGLKYFFVFFSRVPIHKTRKFHYIKHEKVDDCSFQRVVFPSLLHQILGIAYSLAKAIHSSVPVFSLLNILALHTWGCGAKPRISHIFIKITPLIQQYHSITGGTPTQSYVPTQIKRKTL